MEAKCPKNPKHNLFVTVAHVAQDWIVDSQGNFIEFMDDGHGETVAGPHPENTWTCAICGSEAEVDKPVSVSPEKNKLRGG